MEQVQLTCNIAFWLRPSSIWPEVDRCFTVDQWTLPIEVVQALMSEQKETYVYKAAVQIGSQPVQCYWHTKQPYHTGEHVERVSVDEVVKQLWSLFEADGIDPVEVRSVDALGVARAEASDDPAGLLARWCHMAVATDKRAFTERWNDRRSALVRTRLALEEEMLIV